MQATQLMITQEHDNRSTNYRKPKLLHRVIPKLQNSKTVL